MLFESQEPEFRAPHLRWSYLKFPDGTNFRGWIAGRVHGINGHHDFSHKPCRRLLTNGALECKYCKAEIRRSYLGYLPLFDETLRQVVIGISGETKQTVERMELHTPVKVTKAKHKTASIFVKADPYSTLKPNLNERQQKPQSLDEWLLRLWKDAELIAWFAGRPRTMIEEVADPPPAVIPDVSLMTPTREIVFPGKMSERFNRIEKRKRAKEANGSNSQNDESERNGTH